MESYEQPEEAQMPARCRDIYLTMELFSGTAQTTQSILCDYAESVRYWRRFVPEDGLPLNVLVERLRSGAC